MQAAATLFGLWPPLIGFLVLKDRGAFLRDSLRAALNFQLTLVLAELVIVVLAGAGVFSTTVTTPSTTYYTVLTIVFSTVLLLVLLLVLINAVCCVLGALRAARGDVFRYPAIRFIR